ncbi:MAG: alpha/beta fold hydrolase [Alphaproteobacteria bacterium]|nr:alpha/beta fold hydrolase [Alphaproteobacteria bacterium]
MDTRFPTLDRPEVLNVLFHPRRDTAAGASDPRAVRIPAADGVGIGGKIFGDTPGAPAILFFHGNGEIASDYDDFSHEYTKLGITLFVVDFRGYGISESTPTARGLIADAGVIGETARDILAAHHMPCSKLFVMGRSLGSAAAIEIAARPNAAISGLIIESGFADTLALVERLGDIHFSDGSDSRHGFGNLDKIARVTVPTLFIHGEQDWIIPVTDARALHQRCGATSKRLLTIPGAGHNDLMIIGYKPYFNAIRDLVFTA